jgi:hypothetical protein
LTFAITQNGWQGKDDPAPGLLLLLDTRDQSQQLKTNLAEFRQKWTDAGKAIRIERIRDIEFFVLPISSNDVPKTLKKFFPQPAEVQELGAEPERKKAPDAEFVIGQVESLLILGNSTKVVEKVVVQLTGGSAPTLGELAAYQACHRAVFRDAPFYAWLNAKALLDVLGRPSDKKENPQAPNPFDPKPDKLISASGVQCLKSIGFCFETRNDGALFQLFLEVPEAGRQGIFKALAGEAKETGPPPFVPADAVKFHRWRLDGQKAWAALEKMAPEVQWIGTLNQILNSANASARLKDPSFDIKKALIGNLGDDIITYEKAPRGNSPAERESPPAIVLVGCHNAGQAAAALKGVFTLMSQQTGSLLEREFLGRKIFSVPLPPLPLPFSDSAGPAIPRTLSYAASGGYLAFSTTPALLEEYLRSSESQSRTLRETPGLLEAAEKVSGSGASLFGYENRAETMRAAFESMKATPSASSPGNSSSPITSAFGVASPEASYKDWMDFSLLPAFDRVSRYFYFTVYGGNASVEGMTFKLFAPVPPQLRVAPEWADSKPVPK